MKNMMIRLMMLVLIIGIGMMYAEEKKVFQVIKDKCVGCKLCVPVCPTKAITMKGDKAVIDPEKCVGCGLCVPKCPVKAIVPAKGEAKKKNNQQLQPAKEEQPKEVKKAYFINKSSCTGCKECLPVCPTKAIALVAGKAVIDPEKCINCGLCAKACAFNAPKPYDFTPKESK